MPVITISGKSVIDAGSFPMGLEDTEAELDIRGALFLFRIDGAAEKLTAITSDDQGRTVMLLRHHQAGQVSVFRSEWIGDAHRFSAVFTMQGSAPGPNLRGATLITYSVTEEAI